LFVLTASNRLTGYGVSTLTIASAFLLKLESDAWIGPGDPLIFFVPAVTFSAWYGGLYPGLFSTALSSYLCVYYFFHPVGSLFMYRAPDAFSWVLFLVEGVFTCVLMEKLHNSVRRSAESTRRAQELGEYLRQSEERLQAILANSKAVIYLKDLEGRYILVNRQFETLVHYSISQIAGKTDYDIFPNELAETLRVNDLKVLAGKGALEFEESIPQGGGTHTYVSLKFCLSDPSGTPYAIGGVSTDITLLKEAQARAVDAERLAAIGQMVAGLAHESRNSLQRAQACLEMLDRRIKDRPESTRLVADIQQSLDDLQRLYDEVRNYAAPITLNRETCSLATILNEAWLRLEPSWRNRKARIVQNSQADPLCEGDRHRLLRMFRNILENSLAACQDPVEITCEWSQVNIRGREFIRGEVRDNGPGLSAEQRLHLFEPFYTTKTHGTGLGLAIVRRIVEAHEGSVDVGADDWPGTTIVIKLPRSMK
jgi:two-component system, LuxR family, sensor kinase FixL